MGKYKRELVRKIFHLLFLGAIPLAEYTSIRITQFILIVFGASYFFFEQLRLKGTHLPVISKISQLVLRDKEKNNTAFAPITLALGIILVLELYTNLAMNIAIIAATVGDSTAALVGQKFNKRKIWWNKKKSYSGMCANILSVFLCALIWLPPLPALSAGVVSGVVESLNLEDTDNLMIPLSVGASTYFF